MQAVDPTQIPTAKRLKNLLDLADAPITGRKVAAIIEFEDGTEGEGFNTESSSEIIHAEIAAMSNSRGKKIARISLMANGKPMDVKNALPCEVCCDALYANAVPGLEVSLYMNDFTKVSKLSLHDMHASYKEVGTGMDAVASLDDMELNNIDRNLVKDIVASLARDYPEAKMYITGSSAKFGGPKSLLIMDIAGESYWDIDLVIVSSTFDKTNSQSWFKDVYHRALNSGGFSYEAASIRTEQVQSYILDAGLEDSDDFLFRKIYWCDGMDRELMPPTYTKNSSIPSMIDLSVGKTIESTMTPKYYDKIWFSRLV